MKLTILIIILKKMKKDFLRSVFFPVIIRTTADTHHYLIVSRATDMNDKLYRYTYGVIGRV